MANKHVDVESVKAYCSNLLIPSSKRVNLLHSTLTVGTSSWIELVLSQSGIKHDLVLHYPGWYD